MNLTTYRALRAPAPALVGRSRQLAALIAATLALGLSGQIPRDASAAASMEPAPQLRVGHIVKRIVVTGSAQGESRRVDVHLWYPADAGASAEPNAVYKSALHGKTLYPDLWDPLSWTIEAEIAREGAAIDPEGGPFPVIVFSHGSTNDPIDYAHTLELIAAGGFVVAAPSHTNNTQDDARIDFINGQAAAQDPPRPPLFPCNDGRAAPCSRGSVPFSMADRARDVANVLTELPAWFGSRVDTSRAGVMGHSRGTVTALAAAGGSDAWGFGPEPRVKAIMGMAIGAAAITSGVNLAAVTVPTVLVAGEKDTNPPPKALPVSEAAFAAIRSTDKQLVAIPNATHRSFDSTYCAQMQSAGAAFDSDRNGVVEADTIPPEVANTRPILDRHTVGLIAASPPGFLSGKAVHYCAPRFFTSPVNIQQVVASTPNAEYACTGNTCGVVPPVVSPPDIDNPCETTTIPCTGLDTDQVKQCMTELAIDFFGTRLARDRDGDGVPVTADGDQADADGDGVGDACDSHTFGGFLQPVDNPRTINTGRAGRTYPVKFQIRDENGTLVTSLAAVSSITVKEVRCASGDATDTLETSSTGGSSLRFEDDQFVYNWKTPSSAGCYELFVTLADDGAHSANFSLR